MKNVVLILSLFIVVLIPTITRSQSSIIQLGVEGGPSLSTLRYDLFFYPSKYIEAGLGGTGGLSFKYNINKKLSFKCNLLWELKGNTRKGNEDYRLNYITIPVLLQSKFGKSPFFFINYGPYIGFLLPVNGINSYYKLIDLGVTLGLGVEVPINHQFGLTFEIRNNLGLLNISSNHAYNDKWGNPVVELGDLFTNTVVFQTGLVYSLEEKK